VGWVILATRLSFIITKLRHHNTIAGESFTVSGTAVKMNKAGLVLMTLAAAFAVTQLVRRQ